MELGQVRARTSAFLMNRTTITIACLVTLSGCSYLTPEDASTASPVTGLTPEIRTYVYECADGYSFTARTETDRVWLFLPGKTVDLQRVESASGTKYAGNAIAFWNKGDEARLETEALTRADCRNNRARAIWEHAKLNGVDFRALGNEPGWTMEISNKRDILLVTDYGQQSYRFTDATIKSKAHSRTTVYNARNEQDLVEVVITGTTCRDSMSDESFPASVSVLINDRRLQGCGRALH